VALMLDLGGEDKYSQGQTNNAIWLKPLYGVGLDCEAGTKKRGPASLPGARSNSQFHEHRRSQKRLYTIDPVDPHQPIERLLRRAISDSPTRRQRPRS
jgi:hypothetical protein